MTWEYLGGFFDGEGNILFYRNQNKNCAEYPRIYMSQSFERGRRLFEEIRPFLLEEGIRPNKPVTVQKAIGGPEHRLIITGRKNCVRFLLAIMPYLRIKLDEAGMMLLRLT